jgi:molybdate transport system substrate-binding protein
MDWLEEKELLAPDSRRPLLANRLVVIVPEDSRAEAANGTLPPIGELLAERPLAIADPAHVPAGIYAEAALTALGQWEAVAGRTVRTGDVRAALALVDRGEAAAGIVYATDAPIARRARVLATFPAESHPPIVYPVAVVAGRGRPAVAAFLDFLLGPEAAAVFAAHGFARPGPGAD